MSPRRAESEAAHDVPPHLQLHNASRGSSTTALINDSYQRPHGSNNADDHDSPLPTHPSAFTFPSINFDGSLHDELTAHQSTPFPPTPPAALSTLGIRARMAAANHEDTMHESTASFHDEQYDMIDDLSEISNDDHDTASIVSESTESVTREIGEAELDEELAVGARCDTTLANAHRHLDTDTTDSTNPTATALAKLRQDQDENKLLLESIVSDDADTPTQSIMPNFASTLAARRAATATAINATTPVNAVAAAVPTPDQDTNKILIVSDAELWTADMDKVLAKVAFAIDRSPAVSTVDYPVYSVARQDTARSWEPSKMVMRAGNSVSAHVSHCVGALELHHGSYMLLVGSNAKSYSGHQIGYSMPCYSLPKQRIAIFYMSKAQQDLSWLANAYTALRIAETPVLVLNELDDAQVPRVLAESSLLERCASDKLVMKIDEFEQMPLSTLSASLRGICKFEDRVTSPKSKKQFFVRKHARFFFMLLMLLGMLASSFHWQTGAVDSHSKVASRRQALSDAFSKSTGSKTVLKDHNINHLLPMSQADCFSTSVFGMQHVNASASSSRFNCSTHTPYHVVTPNQFLVSLPGLTSFPKVVSTHVFKTNGHDVNFTREELIKGVHIITFDPVEAPGFVHVNMITSSPSINITFVNFHWENMLRALPVSTYHKMTADVSKAVVKDLAVMRNTAKDLTDKLSDEFAAGSSATKNVAREISHAVAREVQVFGESAVAVFEKAIQAKDITVSKLTKDFVLVQRDVVEFTKAVKLRTQDVLGKSRARVMELKKTLRKKHEKARSKQHEKARCKKHGKARGKKHEKVLGEKHADEDTSRDFL